jgi:ADP-heptose:LPS heptosyltransferase
MNVIKKYLLNPSKDFTSLLIFLILQKILAKQNSQYSNNILFINTGQIGDLIISSLILANENAFNDDQEVYLIVKKKYSDIYANYKGKVKIMLWDYNRYRFSILYRIKIIRLIQRLHIKYTFNITTARGPINDELALLSKAEKVFCFQNDSKQLNRYLMKYYNNLYDELFIATGKNEYDKILYILKFICTKEIFQDTKYYLSDGIINNISSEILNYRKENQKIIIVNPLSERPEKDWPLNYYYELTKLLSQNNFVILFQGTEVQKKNINSLIINSQKNINIAGRHIISQSAALIQLADLFIGNDSGFTHIAKALGKPLIGIIGCGSHGIFFPYNEKENQLMLYKDVECKGCEWRCIHEKRICIEDITPELVYENVLEILNLQNEH